MIGNLLLRFHARKSTHPMKDFYSKSDFALILAMEDGYMEKLQQLTNHLLHMTVTI